MADIYIEYLPSIGNPQFDLAARRIVDLLRTYLSEHDTSLSTIESGYVNYVDRGDPSTADVTSASLTLDGTWKTVSPIDLSSIVTAGAKSVLIEVGLSNAAAATYLAFRKPGNTYYNGWIYTQVAGVACYTQLIIPLTSTRTLEYQGSAGSTISIFVRGWWI
jgi:hypothetical protein